MPQSDKNLNPMTRLVPASTHDTLDYSNFRFRAEVDWVQLYIKTENPTNFWTVNERMGEKYTKPLNKDSGGAATEFLIKIQNPQSWEEVESRLRNLTVDHRLAENPDVAAIEISLDAYSKTGSRDELVQMAGRFYKFSTHIGSPNRRTAGQGRGNVSGTDSHGSNLRKLAENQMIVAGNQNDYADGKATPEALRVYVKEVDESKPLPLSEHRARTERTLNMHLLARRPLSVWKRHDFTDEAHYFKFRKLKPLIPAAVRAALELLSQIGEPLLNSKRAAGGGVKRYYRSTVADVQLNRLAYDALRGLNERMRHSSRRTKAREVAEIAGKWLS